MKPYIWLYKEWNYLNITKEGLSTSSILNSLYWDTPFPYVHLMVEFCHREDNLRRPPVPLLRPFSVSEKPQTHLYKSRPVIDIFTKYFLVKTVPWKPLIKITRISRISDLTSSIGLRLDPRCLRYTYISKWRRGGFDGYRMSDKYLTLFFFNSLIRRDRRLCKIPY